MNFFKVLKYEFKSIFTNIPIVMTIIGGVIIYSFFYPQPYSNEVVKSLKITVVDYDKSDTSRELIYSLNASPQIKITRQDISSDEAKQALIEKKVSGIIIIPARFERDLALHVSPTVAVGADANFFLVFGSIVEGAIKSILTQSASVKVKNLLLQDIPLAKAKNSFTAFELKTINLFNVDMSYTHYVIPAVFVLILQQTMLIGLGILGAFHNESKKKYAVAVWMKISSRVLIFGTLFFTHLLFYFGFSFEFFDIPRLASAYNMLTFGTPFVLSTLFLGIFFGGLLKSQESATPIVLLSSLPLIFSAGFIWPKEAMPEFILYLSLLFPSTPAIQGFLKLNQMGADFSAVIVEYGTLWLQVVVYLLLAIYILKRNAYNR